MSKNVSQVSAGHHTQTWLPRVELFRPAQFRGALSGFRQLLPYTRDATLALFPSNFGPNRCEKLQKSHFFYDIRNSPVPADDFDRLTSLGALSREHHRRHLIIIDSVT